MEPLQTEILETDYSVLALRPAANGIFHMYSINHRIHSPQKGHFLRQTSGNLYIPIPVMLSS